MMHRSGKYLDNWRSGLLAVGIHHCLLLLLEHTSIFPVNILDYADALPYHLLNSLAYLWEAKTNLSIDPLWLEAYEWWRRGWSSWAIFIIFASIQWFIVGSGVGKTISIFRSGASGATWRHVPILRLCGAVCLLYLLWYGWIVTYSYRWYLRRLPMSHYMLCGVVNTDYPEVPDVEAWQSRENAARSCFYKAYQSGSAARLATIGYPEEYGPYTTWLFLERAERSVRRMAYVYDSLGSVSFRDFLFKGWTTEGDSEFDEIKLLTYEEVKELYNQSRNLRSDETGDRCLMYAVGFFNSGRDLLYLAVYRRSGNNGRVVDIY